MRIDGWRRRREGLIAAQADPHLALEMRVHGLRVSLKSTDRQHKNHEGEGNLAKALKSNEDHQAKSGTHPCTEQPVASSDDTSDNKEVAYTPTEFGLGWGAWRNCLFPPPPPPPPPPPLPPADSQYLWSYQAKDGQLVFVHPLNMRCLQVHFGAYANMPPELTGRVLEVETWAQDEETLKRWPHLAHLPLTSTLELCEVYKIQSNSRGEK